MIYFIVLIFVKFLQYNDEVSKWAIIRIEMLADNGRGGAAEESGSSTGTFISHPSEFYSVIAGRGPSINR